MSNIDNTIAIASAGIDGFTDLSREDRSLVTLSIDYTMQAADAFKAGDVEGGFTCLHIAARFDSKLSDEGRAATVFGRVRKPSKAVEMSDTEAFERAAGRWPS